jgi:hypothetical protein
MEKKANSKAIEIITGLFIPISINMNAREIILDK